MDNYVQVAARRVRLQNDLKEAAQHISAAIQALADIGAHGKPLSGVRDELIEQLHRLKNFTAAMGRIPTNRSGDGLILDNEMVELIMAIIEQENALAQAHEEALQKAHEVANDRIRDLKEKLERAQADEKLELAKEAQRAIDNQQPS